MEHEAPVELCREHPDVVPAILHHLLKVPLPYYSNVRVTDPNTRTLVATGKRSDAAVILEDGKRPVLAAILEPQGKIDPDKWWAWPKYIADLHAEVHCDTYLIVIALTRGVAAWARDPIRSFQPGRGLIPYVIGPEEAPRLGSVEQARAEPWLAALCAMMHANEQGGEEEALMALQAAKEMAGPKQAWWLYQLLDAIMTPDRCRRMQELMMFNPEAFVPKTEFDIFQFNKGKAEGKADAVVRVLRRRFGYVNESLSQRVHAETRIDLLDTWFDDALMLEGEPALHRLVEQILSTPLPPAAD